MLFDAIEEFVVTFTPNDFAEEISAFGKDGSFVFVRLVLVLVLVIILSFSVFPAEEEEEDEEEDAFVVEVIDANCGSLLLKPRSSSSPLCINCTLFAAAFEAPTSKNTGLTPCTFMVQLLGKSCTASESLMTL